MEENKVKMDGSQCGNEKCTAWRPCGCFQNLEKICKRKISEDDWKVVEARLKSMPDDFEFGFIGDKE